MTHLETMLLGYLSRHCCGAARARKIWKISKDLTALGLKDATPRGIQDALASLRMQYRPVGTTSGSPPGAFLCEDTRDFRRAYRNLYGRLRSQARGCRRFHQCFTETMNGQRRLEFPEAVSAYDALREAPLLAGLEVKT
jgi:hypothetical protein